MCKVLRGAKETKETLDQCSDLHRRKFLGSKETSGGNANIVHSVLYAHIEF